MAVAVAVAVEPAPAPTPITIETVSVAVTRAIGPDSRPSTTAHTGNARDHLLPVPALCRIVAEYAAPFVVTQTEYEMKRTNEAYDLRAVYIITGTGDGRVSGTA